MIKTSEGSRQRDMLIQKKTIDNQLVDYRQSLLSIESLGQDSNDKEDGLPDDVAESNSFDLRQGFRKAQRHANFRNFCK
jgi:hypothetical protein